MYFKMCTASQDWEQEELHEHIPSKKDNHVTNLLPVCVSFQEGLLIWLTNAVRTVSKTLS